MTGRLGSMARYRRYEGPALFRQGFRPFFLGAGVWAPTALALWIAVVSGGLSLPTTFDPVSWHVHEMLFGFVCASIAGFLLTAIPNWTGRLPISGVPLAILSGSWALGRIATALSGWFGAGIAAAVDLSFFLLLFAVVVREIVAGRNWRNLPMAAAVLGLLTANGLMHADALGLADTGGIGQRLAIGVIVMLIGLIGGRIVPSFTRNWLVKRSPGPLPAPSGRFDAACLLFVGAGLGCWIALPEDTLGAGLLLAGGVLSLLRLIRWRGERTLSEPLVWSLHLAYAWIPTGLVLTAISAVSPDVPSTAGLHALTAGAMGAMTLAVMTRATLGHTGHPLTADLPTVAIYVLVSAGAALRVVAAFEPGLPMPILIAAAACWGGAFALFVLVYGRMLLRR